MAGKKKRVVLFASIPRETDDALRKLAYERHVFKAQIVREAITAFLKKKEG